MFAFLDLDKALVRPGRNQGGNHVVRFGKSSRCMCMTSCRQEVKRDLVLYWTFIEMIKSNAVFSFHRAMKVVLSCPTTKTKRKRR